MEGSQKGERLMALVWDVGNVHNWEEVCLIEATEDRPGDGVKKGEKIWHPVTNAIVWASISVELGGITETNAEQWYARLHIIERLFGPMLIRGSSHVGAPEITADEVRAHIGLTVNVSPKSDAKWRNHQITYAINDNVGVYRRAKLAAEKEALAVQ